MASLHLLDRISGARDVAATIPDDFTLQSGQRLGARCVRGRLHGPEHGPLVVVAGGISAGRRVADAADGPGWWSWLVRDGGPVDTRRVRVLAFDWLPDTDAPELLTVTPADQARLLALLLTELGEPQVDAFIGASFGGCVGLSFAALYPEHLGRLLAISAAHRTHPGATAWRGVQRRILQLGLETGREAEAVSLARQLAMTTYRTADEFDLRFGGAGAPDQAGDPYAVCDYLIARGQAYVDQTSARRWIALSDALDRHDVAPEAVPAPLTILGFTSDQLVPVADLQDLAECAPNLDRLITAPSIFGHDAFLKEREVVSRTVETFLSPLLAPCSQEIAA